MTLAEDIRKTMVPEWEGFERLLGDALFSRSDLLNRINAYLLESSGKRLRPAAGPRYREGLQRFYQ